MHSFRHNFVDQLRDAELALRTGWALARLAEPWSGRIYGYGLTARKNAMTKVKHLGLSISHLCADKRLGICNAQFAYIWSIGIDQRSSFDANPRVHLLPRALLVQAKEEG